MAIDETKLKNSVIDGYIDSKANVSSNFLSQLETLAQNHLKSTNLNPDSFYEKAMEIIKNSNKMSLDPRKLTEAVVQIMRVAGEYEKSHATIGQVYGAITQLSESLAQDITELKTLDSILNLGTIAGMSVKETFKDVAERIHNRTGLNDYELPEYALKETMRKYLK